MRSARLGCGVREDASGGVAKGTLEGVFHAADFDLAEAREGLELRGGGAGDVCEAPDGRAECLDVGLVDFADAREGGAEEREVVLLDALLDHVRWAVLELFVCREVRAGFFW